MKNLPIFLIVLVAGSVAYWYWTTTPEHSVGQLKAAGKSHDLVAFKKYVHMDSVASGTVGDLLAAPMRSALGPGIFGQWIVAGVVGIFKQPLVAGVKEDISHFVTTGQLRPPDSDAASPGDAGQQRFSLG